ncbi:protein-disulfide reductase DsbD domain-containing protein [Pontibacter sp. G13]|uniref:protein-disulfide reductase DsbD domain-containing protein n=1 Tax=Pontibacter sp. G13 TaxID=3074898 RepID=UPI00288B9BF1|nr:protein-disulfide reductase DsbD domain-containing protein [Pontibacter sp. G13]WNJ21309.1 protein-disulfide reductase DsbD family protein [Pontibacter sp. G13]
MIRTLKTLSTLLVAVFAVLQVSAQGMSNAAISHELTPEAGLQPGQQALLKITMKLEPGYHVYSANQVEDAEMMATTFQLDEEASGIELLGSLTDKGEKETEFDDVFGFNLSFYHKEVVFYQKVKVTSANPQLVGYMRYQVCDDSRCVPGTYDIEEAL